MRIIQPRVEIDNIDADFILRALEFRGRRCYKSEDRITPDSARKFVRFLVQDRKHTSVIEHEKISVNFVVDRGVSHEIVRHRIAAYSQESTRYCNYGNDDNGITLIQPFFFYDNNFAKALEKGNAWMMAMKYAEEVYLTLLKYGANPQEARSVLPNSLKTEVETTYDLREWRHFFELRCAPAAHPQMRQVAIPTLLAFQEFLPEVFDNIEYDKDFPKEHYAEIIFRII